jgi:hypothetical protein
MRSTTLDESPKLAAVTIWECGGTRTFATGELTPKSPALVDIAEAAAHGSPVWLDVDLDTDVQRWMQPWEELHANEADWSSLSIVAEAVGLELPDGDGDGDSRDQLVLRYLPQINECGVLGWLNDRTSRAGAQPVMPLAGFIPAATLSPRQAVPPTGVEFVLVRVNLAIVGNRLVTIRLTDRLCTGCRPRAWGRRLRADDYYDPPNLTLFRRFLPAGHELSGPHLGDALGSYLAATCSTVPEFTRDRLRIIERHLMGRSPEADAAGGEAITERQDEIVTIRATLETVEEELLRLIQRLSDPCGRSPAIERTVERYRNALAQLDGIEAELRWASDAAASRLATLRFEEQRNAEQQAKRAQDHSVERQKKLETVIAGLGTAVVIAALVTSLFGESVKLPHPQKAWDFLGMVSIMVGASLLVFGLLISKLEAASVPAGEEHTLRRWRRVFVLGAAPSLAALAGVLAGVFVLWQFG